jgi:filamentous hemagglutinin
LDIGLVFHYYKGSTDNNAFLGWDNTTGFLEWFDTGTESGSDFTGSTYGTFKTGGIRLTDATSATTTASGALQVQGGIGAGNIYLSGNANAGTVNARNLTPGRVVIVGPDGQLTDDTDLTYDPVTNLLSANISSSNTATDLAGGATGSLPYQLNPGDTTFLPIGTAGFVLVSDGSGPVWTTAGTVTSGEATTATNLNFGAQYQIPYQTAPGATAFEDNFKYLYDTDTLVTVNAQFTGTSNAVGPASGAVQIAGGVYVAQDAYIGGSIAVLGGSIKSVTSSFDLLPTTATTVNFASSATALTMGWISGSTTIRNKTNISSTENATSKTSGALQVAGGAGFGGDVWATNLTATSFIVAQGGDVYLQTNGARISVSGTTANVLNDYVTTVNIANNATAVSLGSTGSSAVTVKGTTQSSSTNSGALQVVGGAGIGGNLYVGGTITTTGDIAANGGDLTTDQTTFNLVNTNATTVNIAGAGTAVTIGATTGYTEIRNATTVTNTTNATSTNTGALQVVGGVGIGGALYVGGNTVVLGDVAINGGDLTTDQTTFNLVNTNATTVNIAGAGTAVNIGATTGYTEIRNATTITNTTNATSTNTGALQVQGGVGVANSVWIGNALRVIGASTLNNLSAAVTTATQLTVNGTASVSGIIFANDASNSNAVNNGSIQTQGGIGVVKDVYVGGTITAGATLAATTGTVVNGFFTNNTLIASFTSNVITGTAQVNLDFWSSTNYRSARYFVQIVDGANVHVSEISLFHDGVKAYINEYGIATNNGQLGSFDAIIGGGNVTVKFTPTNATAMTIKMVRTTISA